MDLNDLHPKIKEFLGDLSPDNYKVHTVGVITVYDFKFPKIRIYFYTGEKESVPSIFFTIDFSKVYVGEDEMIRRINMKIFW
jgi:hypothetical protein